MVQRVDDHVLIDDEAQAPKSRREARLDDEAEVVGQESRSSRRQVGAQRLAFSGKVRRAGIEVHDGGAFGRDRRQGGRDDLAHVVPHRLQGPPHPARAVTSHQHDGRTTLSVTVAGEPLEVRVKLEVVDRVLVVTLDETDGDHAAPEHTQDAQRDLVLVGTHHLNAPSVRFEHRRVVDADSERLRDGRLLVGIDGAHAQERVAATEHLDHVAGALARRVLCLIEVRELHLLVERVDHLLRLARRGEHSLARQVEMRIVKRQRYVCQRGDRHGGRDDPHRVRGGGEASEARLERKPDAQTEQEQHGREPPNEPQRVDDVESTQGGGYRRASVRMLTRRPTRMTVKKNPRSDRNTAPVANGVKCATSDRFVTMVSNGSGSR